jgi:hypothetical protein
MKALKIWMLVMLVHASQYASQHVRALRVDEWKNRTIYQVFTDVRN